MEVVAVGCLLAVVSSLLVGCVVGGEQVHGHMIFYNMFDHHYQKQTNKQTNNLMGCVVVGAQVQGHMQEGSDKGA